MLIITTKVWIYEFYIVRVVDDIVQGEENEGMEGRDDVRAKDDDNHR